MPLEWGVTGPLLIRRERLDLGLGLRLLYASDLHLRPSQGEAVTTEILLAAEKVQPHAVLLGGDMVDCAQAIPLLEGLVGTLSRLTRVGAVSGNHDLLAGRFRIRDCVLSAGGAWLEDEPIKVGDLTVAGHLDQAPPPKRAVGFLRALPNELPASPRSRSASGPGRPPARVADRPWSGRRVPLSRGPPLALERPSL